MTKLQHTILAVLKNYPEGLSVEELSDIIWNIDVEHYKRYGKSLTGSLYIKV